MKKTVDLRGLVCPEPVLRTKKLLDDTSIETVEALVESEVNVNNLQRLAKSLKLRFHSVAEENDCFRVTLERGENGSATSGAPLTQTHSSPAPRIAAEEAVGTVVFIAKDKFGDGDPEFSNNLLNMFLQTLLQSGHRPRAILMANTGVKLLAPGSSTLTVLDDFKSAGVEVLACGLCLEYYGLKGKIPTEQITNMFAICEFLMVADKVIQP
jgi:selenium metabolism protein YedF